MDTEKQVLTIAEAAALKGVRRSSVHKAIQEGRLTAHVAAIGVARTVWKINRADLEAWHVATPQERGRRGAAAKHGKGEQA